MPCRISRPNAEQKNRQRGIRHRHSRERRNDSSIITPMPATITFRISQRWMSEPVTNDGRASRSCAATE
jgi:hypothetical protein